MRSRSPSSVGPGSEAPSSLGSRVSSARWWTLGHTHELIRPHPFLESRLHVLRLQIDIAARRIDRLIERKIPFTALDEALGDFLDTRLTERDLPQQHRLHAGELFISRGLGLHRAHLVDRNGSRSPHVLRITGVMNDVKAACASRLELRSDRVDEPGLLAQLDAQTRRVKTATEYGTA